MPGGGHTVLWTVPSAGHSPQAAGSACPPDSPCLGGDVPQGGQPPGSPPGPVWGAGQVPTRHLALARTEQRQEKAESTGVYIV